MAKQYTDDSISFLSRKEYLEFYKELFPLFREHTKDNGRIAFLIADWPPARRERLFGHDGNGGRSEAEHSSFGLY